MLKPKARSNAPALADEFALRIQRRAGVTGVGKIFSRRVLATRVGAAKPAGDIGAGMVQPVGELLRPLRGKGKGFASLHVGLPGALVITGVTNAHSGIVSQGSSIVLRGAVLQAEHGLQLVG